MCVPPCALGWPPRGCVRIALWPLLGHFSACEPAPSWESALLRLEFVYCSPLGISSEKEDTFRKLSSQERF